MYSTWTYRPVWTLYSKYQPSWSGSSYTTKSALSQSPAPISGNGPVPGSNLKREAARESKSLTVAIESFHSVPVRLTEVLKTSVFERILFVIAPIVGFVVAVPMIIVHVRQVADASAFPAILLGRGGA